MQRGFSVVELMVTLFIGVLAILGGYQLYASVNASSGNSRARSLASNIAYDVLRKEGGTYQNVTNNCSSPAITTVSRSIPDLSNVEIRLERCKPNAVNGLIKVTVVLKYGNSEHGTKAEVKHAAFISN